jgi:hypothetical protein
MRNLKHGAERERAARAESTHAPARLNRCIFRHVCSPPIDTRAQFRLALSISHPFSHTCPPPPQRSRPSHDPMTSPHMLSYPPAAISRPACRATPWFSLLLPSGETSVHLSVLGLYCSKGRVRDGAPVFPFHGRYRKSRTFLFRGRCHKSRTGTLYFLFMADIASQGRFFFVFDIRSQGRGPCTFFFHGGRYEAQYLLDAPLGHGAIRAADSVNGRVGCAGCKGRSWL